MGHGSCVTEGDCEGGIESWVKAEMDLKDR